jgi:ribosomal protein S18 acetylase RimI-like enzyme
MAISASISRLTVYYKRHGCGSTLRRFSIAARRTLFSSRMVLFYCDLSTLSSSTSEMPSRLKVERHRSQADISPQDLQEITSFWNPDLARRNINHRFELGASLWLIKFEDKLAGYGWTLRGRTVEPHYFRLGQDDVHLFDFHVFPQYRGRGLNPHLVNHILRGVAAECQRRAFIEAAEWNQAQLASLRRTPFRRLSSARKFTIFDHTIVCWARDEAMEQKNAFKNAPLAAAGSKQTSITDQQESLQSTEAQ